MIGSHFRGQVVRHAIFVVRCSATDCLSYVLAAAVALEHPAWAVVSSLIVSQDSLRGTGQAAVLRFLGTAIGISSAVVVGTLLTLINVQTAVQISASVAIGATLSRVWPDLKVAMWTAPIVYLTVGPETSLAQAGFWRGVEVLVGGTASVCVHGATEILIRTVFHVGGRLKDSGLF